MTTETPLPPLSAEERPETTTRSGLAGGTLPLEEAPHPETGEALIPTEPGAPPARRRAGKAGARKPGKTAAKRKPGKKVPARAAAAGKGKFAREGMKTKGAAGRKPRAAQKKGPKKAAAVKKAAKARRSTARGRR